MRFETPFGPAWASVNESGALTALGFGDEDRGNGGYGARVESQLREYFARKRQSFNLPLAAAGTDFQKRVWAELSLIPFGQTLSYNELASRIGRPGAARAVGRANATNPIALIVPCHRVIGSGGKMTGYAFGIALKEKLLQWEKSGPVP